MTSPFKKLLLSLPAFRSRRQPPGPLPDWVEDLFDATFACLSDFGPTETLQTKAEQDDDLWILWVSPTSPDVEGEVNIQALLAHFDEVEACLVSGKNLCIDAVYHDHPIALIIDLVEVER